MSKYLKFLEQKVVSFAEDEEKLKANANNTQTPAPNNSNNY